MSLIAFDSILLLLLSCFALRVRGSVISTDAVFSVHVRLDCSCSRGNLKTVGSASIIDVELR